MIIVVLKYNTRMCAKWLHLFESNSHRHSVQQRTILSALKIKFLIVWKQNCGHLQEFHRRSSQPIANGCDTAVGTLRFSLRNPRHKLFHLIPEIVILYSTTASQYLGNLNPVYLPFSCGKESNTSGFPWGVSWWEYGRILWVFQWRATRWSSAWIGCVKQNRKHSLKIKRKCIDTFLFPLPGRKSI